MGYTGILTEVADLSPSSAREPLEPGPASSLRRWLPGTSQARLRTRTRVLLFVVLIAVTLALGTWGFSLMILEYAKGRPGTPGYSPAEKLTLLESFYRAVKLYTLDIGPGAGGYAQGPNWQVLVAFLLAVMTVLRALIGLAGARVRRSATRRLVRGHVIICGAGVHGSRLARELAGEHDVVLIDSDATAPGMRTASAPHEWRIVGDAVEPETLLAAGAPRASWLVAVTGDDFVNSQIVSAMHTLESVRDRVHVLVQVEDPSLARFLEEEPADGDGVRAANAGRPVVTPFSANAIAAEALLRELRRKAPGGEAPLLEPGSSRAPHLILVGDHPLLDAIVLAALRRWRVHTLRALERNSAERQPPLRISVYGPDAVERLERLRRRWRPESSVIELEARDAGAAGEVQVEQDEWLVERNTAGHAIVACARELDGVRLTLAVSRALGGGVLMTRVTTQPESVLDGRLRERTAHSDWLATTDVRALADLACDPGAIARAAARQRLESALERDFPAAQAAGLTAQLFGRRTLRMHSDATWRVPACERVLLEQLLAPAPVSAFVDAGLAVDLEDPENLRHAADGLLRSGQRDAAFMAWCEYVRHLSADSAPALRAGLDALPGDELADAILRLRAAVLEPRREAAPSGPLAGATRVAIFAGGAASMTAEARDLLEPVLRRALDGYDGLVLSGGTAAGLPGLIGEVARDGGVRAIGYVPAGLGDRHLYPLLRETDGSQFSVLEPLAMWSDILAAGVGIDDVRVVACPGGVITDSEILLARALGARVVWLDPAGDAQLPLEDALPFGADGVLEIPADAMTLRSFLIYPYPHERLPEGLREDVARHLHAAYRRNQRRRKAASDPAMAPWEELLPVLQRSNLAQADDIPTKLALVGRRLAPDGGRLVLSGDQLELLSELEHGRYNLERLSAGWEHGERQLVRRATPYLKPWDELSDEAREWDRDAVRSIDPALAAVGWGVAPA